MTPVRLNEILTNPRSVSEKEIEVLETLTREFPYYNLPHILLAKVYKEQESYKYDQQIKKASLRSLDRKWLYEYINEVKEVENGKLKVESIEAENEVEISEEISEPKPDEKEEEEVENKVEEIEKEEVEVKSVEVEQSLAPANSLPLGAASFSDWLKQLSQPSENEIKPKKNIALPLSHSPTSRPIPQSPNQAVSTSPKTEDTLSVIDNFLKNNPSISHPKTEFFKAERVAKKSLELEDDIVTETLASIYAKQGHTEQAVWAYEKLILKFPQKEAYFAALIDELKKEQKQ